MDKIYIIQDLRENMYSMRKYISFLLAITLFACCAVTPAAAEEDPMAVKNLEEFGVPGQQPVVQAPETVESVEATESVPEGTVAAVEEPAGKPEDNLESVEETVCVETTPAETMPEESVPEEPKEPEEPMEPEADEKDQELESEAEKGNRVSASEDMPLYFQTDYPDNRYANGSLAENGCSVTSLAMVATYMTGHTYEPVELARYFGKLGKNNIERLEIGSEKLGLAFRKAENWHKARAALQEGKVAILLLGAKSMFTDTQHFIVVTGINEEGRYLVNDPYEPNYDHWKLKQGFENGFEEKDLIYGYSGAWIYDKDAMPEEYEIYSEPDLDRSNPRYPDIQLTYEEQYLLACVVWVEARGESPEGQQAVAEVVLNRLASDRFPSTLRNVIYSEGQFRSVKFLKDATPGQAQYDAIDRAIYGPNILPEDVYHFATFQTNENPWGVIGGHIFCYGAD